MPELLTSSPCAKGIIPYCLDEMSLRPNARENLENLRRALQAAQETDFAELERVFERWLFEPIGYAPDNRRQQVEALGRYWFDRTSPHAYFKELQPIASTYAAGVIKTLELSLYARPEPLPIYAWWIMGFARVELINLANAKQVTLLILTPEPEHVERKLIGDRSEVWTTVRGVVTRKLAGDRN
jgi:hypothetical protein